jgi:hypothetical protein
MCGRIVHQQSLDAGGVVELAVGGNESNGTGTRSLMAAINFERYGELHCIVGAERVRVAQPRGIAQ